MSNPPAPSTSQPPSPPANLPPTIATPQTPIPNRVVSGPVPVDTLNIKVTLIEAFSIGQTPQHHRCHSATSFFYSDNDDFYLVTNRHVVVSEDKQSYPDILRKKVRTSRTSMLPTRTIEIPSYDGTSPLWIEQRARYNSRAKDYVNLERR